MKHGSEHVRKRIMSLMVSAIWLGATLSVLSSCSGDPRLEGLTRMEQPQGVPPSRDRIQELEATIEEYEAIVNEKVRAAMRQASYLKLLAQEYMRNDLYGPALDTLQEALLIEPRNQVLHQLSGVCAGYLAKAQVRPELRDSYYEMAEQSYLKSLEIDPTYQDGLYGLGALYHFELGRHLDAVQVLDTLVEETPGHISGLFVLARAHAALGNVDAAVAAYDQIIELASDRESANQARRNRRLLTGDSL